VGLRVARAQGKAGGTGHMTSQEGRERESSEFPKKKNKQKKLQMELMQFGSLQKEFVGILEVYKLPLISQNPLISK
jgi:hypothetical protein